MIEHPKYYTSVWTPRPCPICGADGDDLKPLKTRIVNCDVDDGFCVFEHHDVCCQVCGFVFASKVPTDEFLIDFQNRTTLSFEKTYDPEARLSLIRELVPKGGKVLEVGGARHEFTELLRVEDYEVSVKEIGDPWPDDEYDAIVSYFVLEHVPDPRGFMREIAKRLIFSGVAVFEVPDYEHYTVYSMFREHLNHFTRRSIANLMRIAEIYIGDFNFRCDKSREYGVVVWGTKLEIKLGAEEIYHQCQEEYGNAK